MNEAKFEGMREELRQAENGKSLAQGKLERKVETINIVTTHPHWKPRIP